MPRGGSDDARASTGPTPAGRERRGALRARARGLPLDAARRRDREGEPDAPGLDRLPPRGAGRRQRLHDLLAPGARIYYETHYAPLLQMQGRVREIAVELVRADGGRLPALLNSTLVCDEEGEPRVIRTTVFDASERRRYERELQRARSEAESRARAALALAHVNEGVLLVTADGRCRGDERCSRAHLRPARRRHPRPFGHRRGPGLGGGRLARADRRRRRAHHARHPAVDERGARALGRRRGRGCGRGRRGLHVSGRHGAPRARTAARADRRGRLARTAHAAHRRLRLGPNAARALRRPRRRDATPAARDDRRAGGPTGGNRRADPAHERLGRR